jgi:hypothetical protein
MTRLATMIIEKRGLFFPIMENIMTDPNDSEKPGLFLELYPDPLSRLFTVLLWKINQEQDGDATILRSTWLKDFANFGYMSLVRHRAYLHKHKIISALKLGGGHEYLYRICDPKTGLPMTVETDIEAVKRLRDAKRSREVVTARVMRRYKKRIYAAPIPLQEQEMTQSSWSECP